VRRELPEPRVAAVTADGKAPIRASIMGGEKLAESDVEERKSKREREGIGRFARCQRKQADAHAGASYSLRCCAARCPLVAVLRRSRQLQLQHLMHARVAFFRPTAGVSIALALSCAGSWGQTLLPPWTPRLASRRWATSTGSHVASPRPLLDLHHGAAPQAPLPPKTTRSTSRRTGKGEGKTGEKLRSSSPPLSLRPPGFRQPS